MGQMPGSRAARAHESLCKRETAWKRLVKAWAFVLGMGAVLVAPAYSGAEEGFWQALWEGKADQFLNAKKEEYKAKFSDVWSQASDYADVGAALSGNETFEGASRGMSAGAFVFRLQKEPLRQLDQMMSTGQNSWDSASWFQGVKRDERREVISNLIPSGGIVSWLDRKVEGASNIADWAKEKYGHFSERVQEGREKLNDFMRIGIDSRAPLDVRGDDRVSLEESSHVLGRDPLPQSYYGQMVDEAAKQSGLDRSQYAYKDPRQDPYWDERKDVYESRGKGNDRWIDLNKVAENPKGGFQEIRCDSFTCDDGSAPPKDPRFVELCDPNFGPCESGTLTPKKDPRFVEICSETYGCGDEELRDDAASRQLMAKLGQDMQEIERTAPSGSGGGLSGGEELSEGSALSGADKLAMLKSLRSGLGLYREQQRANDERKRAQREAAQQQAASSQSSVSKGSSGGEVSGRCKRYAAQPNCETGTCYQVCLEWEKDVEQQVAAQPMPQRQQVKRTIAALSDICLRHSSTTGGGLVSLRITNICVDTTIKILNACSSVGFDPVCRSCDEWTAHPNSTETKNCYVRKR